MELIFNNDPTDENTKNCKHCGETVFYNRGSWLHWNTGEVDCEIGEDENDSIDAEIDRDPFYIIELVDLFSTLGEILKPQ